MQKYFSGIVCVCESGIVCTCYDLHKVLLCKNIYSGIFCMCYDLHIMQIIYLHGHFAPKWKNSNYSKIVIFACNYTRIGMIACNTYQKWYICSMQTITVCAILSICPLPIFSTKWPFKIPPPWTFFGEVTAQRLCVTLYGIFLNSFKTNIEIFM